MIEASKIDEIVSKIATKFNPDKIILFGSYANGTPNEDSDLDLLIVQDTELPRYKRSNDIRLSLMGTKIPIDILVYTNEEFIKEKSVQCSFLKSVVESSKVMYERS